jgi:hypothetical protein
MGLVIQIQTIFGKTVAQIGYTVATDVVLMPKNKYLFGVKFYDKKNDSDEQIAAVMCSYNGNPEGPWHDIAICNAEWAWEIFYALSEEKEDD